MDGEIMACILVGIVCAFIGAWIGEAKGQRTAGFCLGLFLGPLGLLIICFVPGTPPIRICYKCKNKVPSDNKFCSLCGTDLRMNVTVECPYCKKAFPI